ncbi:MAG TPA: ERF family protein [Xanthobacteraceae bacterium]|nr:ERF family protein [Xanthobacteraceae bacterium]
MTETTANALVREIIANKGDPAYLREILAVREAWDAAEARKAYNLALAEFQRRCPIVEKLDEADGKQYARLDRIWREIRPLLTEVGLSVTWLVVELQGWTDAVNKDGGSAAVCHLEGQLRHKLGHGERLVFDLPLPKRIMTRDGRDVQNAAQQMGSATSYGRRYATCLALGVVTGDDDDGNGTRADLTLSEEQEKEVIDLLEAARGVASFNENSFWAFVGCDKVRDIYKRQHPMAVALLKKRIKGDTK